MSRTLWPHQERGIKEVMDALFADKRRVILTSPTGGGKSVIMQQLATEFYERGHKVSLYSNRRMLIEQLSAGFHDAGIRHGVRAAGWEDNRDHPVQISSVQTESSRVLKRKSWNLHDSKLVLVDEGHLQKDGKALELFNRHHDAGAGVVWVTATPIEMQDVKADVLVVAGTNSELRGCGALVPANQYGPDEPDLRKFKALQQRLAAGVNPSEALAAQAMMNPTIMARVWEWFKKLNPLHLPTLLFAPGVKESIWFAEKFNAQGVRAAHIDGEDIWLDGELHPSDSELRAHVLAESKAGRIVVLCNRFVLREGIDCPWLRHGIFATIFGSKKSYLQSGGRLLRADNDPVTCDRWGPKDFATIQDHGGNWWRHGSLNADQEWDLDTTESSAVGLRQERIRKGKEPEPFRCPQCGRIWVAGRQCQCGLMLDSRKKSRPVVSTDGTLSPMVGDIFKPHRVCKASNGEALWEKMYYRSKTEKGERTFRAAMALFAQENYWGWPDPNWRFMPKHERDLFRLVKDVPPERLR